jgi:hypothetical protein
MGKKSRSEILRDEHPGSSFGVLRTFLGLKILKFFDADPDPGCGIFLALDPGSKMEKFGSEIRDKHPGTAILAIFIIFV